MGDTIADFEAAIREAGSRPIDVGRMEALAGRALWKLARILPGRSDLSIPMHGDLFSILMSPGDFAKCAARFAVARRKAVYVFDAFPRFHGLLELLGRRFGVERMFISSRDATAAMARRAVPFACHWVPEGISPDAYRQRDYADRQIDVLQFGRRFEWYHERVVKAFRARNIDYRFQADLASRVFPTREAFLDGLSRTKISICVPRSVTHPEDAGQITTMTVRYLQSMASKCLVVGVLPEEMLTLFGYNPIVEIDQRRPDEQILAVLDNFESYIPLIERNHQEVMSRHTWWHRWNQIQALLGVAVTGATP